ncbi:unnamed protein product [Adineta steineri]|uniref:Myosin N-terminal SH3-like domain-containing protein n=1 Tax=Adineta steineri TaxID=433720 RepID=A0A818ID77_9BILA|nr:unnamed protein product [Adineta steineri]CAF3880363.1 unnamed protein product [Adineta steineri]
MITLNDNKPLWIRDNEHGFILGKIHDIATDNVTVQLNENKKVFFYYILAVSYDSVFQAEEYVKDVDDNCALMCLNEGTLLNNVRCRYKKKSNLLQLIFFYFVFDKKYSVEFMIFDCFGQAGLINGILTMTTFKNKIVCGVSCGLYLFGASITTLLIMILFALKCWILVFSKIAFISNPIFLDIQCISFDFLLQSCLNIDQWLNGCVAGERAFITLKGTRSQKNKSKQAAKIIIIILIISTSIYDPFYRNLIGEVNDSETRIWCIVPYSSNSKIFISAMQFSLFCSIYNSRQQSNVQTDRNYNQILQQQLHEHKNLLITPIILVILALPRLIIYYVSVVIHY